MKNIVMLLSNAFRPDPRVIREATLLSEVGYKVTIICWDRQAELSAYETVNGVQIIRIQTVQSGYGSGWRQLFYLPRFWREAIRVATEENPDVIHCHDLDTLYAGWCLKKRLNCSLIYDAHEHYPALMSLYLPKLFVKLLEYWEQWLIRQVDGIITASTILRDEFMAQGLSPVITLGNYQEVKPYLDVPSETTQALRATLEIPANQLAVGYIGGFSRNRLLLPFIETANHLPDTQFHLWGDGAQRTMIEQTVEKYPNVYYHGWLASTELPQYFKALDVIYYCLRLDYPGAIYNAPNTLSQAMSAGRPIIANNVGDLGRIIKAVQCGVLLNEATPQTIATGIQLLQNKHVRDEVGNRALKAAQQTYNTDNIRHQLLSLYEGLLT